MSQHVGALILLWLAVACAPLEIFMVVLTSMVWWKLSNLPPGPDHEGIEAQR